MGTEETTSGGVTLGRATLGWPGRLLCVLAVFAILLTAVMSRPEKRLTDFDQAFYLSIAYDISRHGVFSNGILATGDRTPDSPAPGMFFMPVYPALVAAAMAIDPRFDRAVECHVLAQREKRDLTGCEFYARPIHILHAALQTLAVVAIALTAFVIFGGTSGALLAGGLAMLALVAKADLFSFVMTGSTSVALFSAAALPFVLGLKTGRIGASLAAGGLLGLLILARPSFAAMAPMWALAMLAGRRWVGRESWTRAGAAALALAAACILVVSPWIVRNAIAVGKAGLSEEYGSAAIVERLAYNTMTAQEFALAFPYCIPVAGPALVSATAGPQAMSRFAWDRPGSFFKVGRAHREALLQQYGKLDPVMPQVIRAEFEANGLKHMLTTVPLAWCGLWISNVWSLVLLPFFFAALAVAWQRGAWLFLLYAAPALLMVGLHAAVSNHYPRYNLMLIGPIAVGTAWLLSLLFSFVRTQRLVRDPI